MGDENAQTAEMRAPYAATNVARGITKARR
jgi:hypothetical protein